MAFRHVKLAILGLARVLQSKIIHSFRKFHLLEVNEVSEVKEVNDVCFVRQMAIFIPYGGIVDNFRKLSNTLINKTNTIWRNKKKDN